MWPILMILLGAVTICIHAATPVYKFSDRLARGMGIAAGVVIVAVGVSEL